VFLLKKRIKILLILVIFFMLTTLMACSLKNENNSKDLDISEKYDLKGRSIIFGNFLDFFELL